MAIATRQLLLLGALTFVPAPSSLPNPVTIRGVAKDCLPNQEFTIEGVDISVFDPLQNAELTSLLRSIDAIDLGPEGTRSAGWDALNQQFEQLMVQREAARPVSRTVTDSLGIFSLTVAAMDTALVLAWPDHSHDPIPYIYMLLSARRDTTLLLDMSGGQCTSMFKW